MLPCPFWQQSMFPARKKRWFSDKTKIDSSTVPSIKPEGIQWCSYQKRFTKQQLKLSARCLCLHRFQMFVSTHMVQVVLQSYWTTFKDGWQSRCACNTKNSPRQRTTTTNYVKRSMFSPTLRNWQQQPFGARVYCTLSTDTPILVFAQQERGNSWDQFCEIE